ncbi:uncharacterized protein EDB91DRAFT_1254282 [Suillus paluster]|uniref:uncharacterized protein n=1 Tax=Suillus paluster TaxID=48578 RepID=UPI001B861546|nr:uncharacterized protein EDB91DRAFT_1254282 [Suillus paluster]KAG1726508.1 hypothetical protein EDB91DRAFT_1254282 [Suillus paluster]
MSNSTTLFTYELNDFTAWDSANVLEYATSRFAVIWLVCDQSHVPQTPAYKASFVQHLQWEADRFAFPYINLCLVMNIHPTMPDLLHLVIACFTCFQTGTINAEELHDKFFECCSPNDQELWSNHRVIHNYSHHWWKDHFDRLGFELPMLTIQEVMEMTREHFEQLPIGAMLMPGPAVTGQVDSDALFNQIVVVRAHLRHLSEAMASLLEQKTQIAAVAASTISQLEVPIDEVEQALINSHRRFHAEQ